MLFNAENRIGIDSQNETTISSDGSDVVKVIETFAE